MQYASNLLHDRLHFFNKRRQDGTHRKPLKSTRSTQNIPSVAIKAVKGQKQVKMITSKANEDTNVELPKQRSGKIPIINIESEGKKS